MSTPRLPVWLAGLALLSALFGRARIQAQATDASILGRVFTSAGVPIREAIVSVRNEANGFTATTRSSRTGLYAFVQLPLGGPYTVTARRVGFRPRNSVGHRLTLGARVTVDLEFEEAATDLATIIVTEDGDRTRAGRLGGSTRIGAEAMAALPAAGRNFTDLAGLYSRC